MRLRSLLFVPGDRPERFAKAAACGADAIILDLEDSVAPARKADARAATRAYLDDVCAVIRIVRINAQVVRHLCGLTWGAEDLPAAIGAATSRETDGRYTAPYETATVSRG